MSMVVNGDTLEWLPRVPDASVDACVTDPPYHLTSVVKRFGADGAAPAKSDGATGVYARSSAGFMGKKWDGGDIAFRPETWAEILRVLKPGAHLVAFGGSRTYHRLACAVEDAGFEIRDQIMWLYGSGFPKSHNQEDEWKGWGTALKPAHEPIVLARKPFKATVAKNLAEHGCGALNIDGCRVAGDPWKPHTATGLASQKFFTRGAAPKIEKFPHHQGRWPANVCHDGSDEVAEMLGEPARFFYCAKASKKDRGEGNNHPTVKPTELMRWLCRLVTPPGGTVLDPFMGSGTTGVAALAEGFRFLGFEQDPAYFQIAKARTSL